MSVIRGTARELERRQWSDLNRFRTDLVLYGRGEGYVEEVYFGKGFSNPPTFTYSAVSEISETATLSFGSAAPRGSLGRGLDVYGLGNDSHSHGGMIQDPSFESQAKYWPLDAAAAATIPSASSAMQGFWAWADGAGPTARWLPLRTLLSGSFTNTWAPRFEQSKPVNDWFGPHRWIQTDDSRERWMVDFDQCHDLGVGSTGQASAKVVVGGEGVSNWLIPVDADHPAEVPMNDWGNAWRVFRSVPEVANVGGFEAHSYPPPYLEGFSGFLYVNADGPVTLESKAVYSCEGYTGPRGEARFPDSAYNVDWGYRELATVESKETVVGGGWRRVNVDLPYQGWRAWPEGRECLVNRGDPDDTFWTLMFRVKAAPGTTVHVDNIYVDRQFRNVEFPILTVGVDEWIRDEAGVYIGAKLWVKVGNPIGALCTDTSTSSSS